MEYSGTSDIESLKVFVENTNPIPINISDITSTKDVLSNSGVFKSSIQSLVDISHTSKTEPTETISVGASVSDLSSANGNLKSIVPTGFVLVHNDLSNLLNTINSNQLFTPTKETSPVEISIPSSTEENTSTSASINMNPDADDLAGFNGDLSAIVPTGFILVHNDLSNLSEIVTGISNTLEATDFGYSGDSGAGIMDIINSVLQGKALKAGVTAATGAAAGKGIASAGAGAATKGGLAALLTNPYVLAGAAAIGVGAYAIHRINTREERAAEKHMESVINDITLDVTAQDLLKNPDIIEARDSSYAAFLEAYYNEQIKSMKKSIRGSSFGNSTGNFFISLSNTLNGNTDLSYSFSNIMQEVVLALDANLNEAGIQSIITDDSLDLQNIQRHALSEYVRAYYDAQISGLRIGNIGENVGKLFGGTISGLITTIFKDTALGPLFSSSLEKVINRLNDNIDPNLLSNDSNVILARNKGIASFVEAYYTAQAEVLSVNNLGPKIGAILASPVTGVVEMVNQIVYSFTGDLNPLRNKIGEVIHEVTQRANPEELANNPIILDAQAKGISKFIELHYNSLANAEISADLYNNSSRNASSILNNISAEATGSSILKEKLNTILEELAQNLSTTDIINHPTIKNAQAMGIASYIEKFFDLQSQALVDLEADTYDDRYKRYNDEILGRMTLDDEDQQFYVTKLSECLKFAISSISTSDINMDSLKSAQETGILNYVTKYFELQKDALNDSRLSRVATLVANSHEIQTTFRKYTKDFSEVAMHTAFDNMPNLAGTNEIKDIQTTKLKDIVRSILNKTSESIKNSFQVNITPGLSNALNSLSENYQNSIKNAIDNTGLNSDLTSSMMDPNDETNNTLNKINDTLMDIKNFLGAITTKDSKGNIVILNGNNSRGSIVSRSFIN